MFTPKKPEPLWKDIPFFEDSSTLEIAGHATRKTIDQLKGEVIAALSNLGATGMYFVDGMFEQNGGRHGWQIHFNLHGIPGRLDCAALPVRSEKKLEAAQAQALYLLRDKLKAQYFSALHEPDSVPLAQYLIGTASNGLTFQEMLIKGGQFPQLGSGA